MNDSVLMTNGEMVRFAFTTLTLMHPLTPHASTPIRTTSNYSRRWNSLFI